MLHWNVEGLKGTIRDINCKETKFFAKYDVLCFVETFSREPTDIQGFYGCHSLSPPGGPGNSGRPVRGISIYLSAKFGTPVSYTARSEYLIVRCSSITVICFYFNPSTADIHIVDTVTEVLQDENKPNINILMTGDFNARSDKNQNGNDKFETLINTLHFNSFSLCNDKEMKTYKAHKGSSTIDHIFVDKSKLRCIKCETMTNTSITKHLPVYGLFKIILITNKIKCTPKSKMSNKIDLTVANIFIKTNVIKFNQHRDSKDLHGLLTLYKQLIEYSATEKKNSRTAKPWFDSQLYIIRKTVLETLHKLKDVNFKDLELLNIYNLQNKNYKTLRVEKQDLYNNKKELEIIEEAERTCYTYLRKDNKAQIRSCIPMDKWHTHFSTLYNRQGLQKTDSLKLKQLMDFYVSPAAFEPFTPEEISALINKSKNKKAAGPDLITNEQIKALAGLTTQLLVTLFNSCVETQNTPEEWSTSLLKVLYKGKGDLSSVDNHRGVALGSNIRKLFSKGVANKLEKYILHMIPPEQYGFMKGKSTIQAIKVLHNNILNATTGKGGCLYVAFVDLSKAFDGVNRILLMECMRDFNTVPVELLLIVALMLSINYITVNDGMLLSELILQSNGVLQGDPCSSLFFNCLTRTIPSNINEATDNKTSTIMYADDLTFMTQGLEILQKAFDRLHTWCTHNEMLVNVGKTKIVKFRKGGRPSKNQRITYNNKEIEFVNSFKFLGVTFQMTGRSFTKHTTERCAAAITAMNLITKLRLLSIETALALFELKVAPIATYGIEVTWPYLNKTDLNKIESVKATYIKKCLSVSKFTKSRLVYALANCNFFVTDIKYKFKLPNSPAYEKYLSSRLLKARQIDPLFPTCSTMMNRNWIKAVQKDRHIFTRFAVHGFHHLICQTPDYHDIRETCMCLNCKEPCNLYHLDSCPPESGRRPLRYYACQNSERDN